MAKCEKRQIVPVPPVEYVLTLSEAEAKWMRRTLGASSNCDDIKFALYYALRDAGVKE